MAEMPERTGRGGEQGTQISIKSAPHRLKAVAIRAINANPIDVMLSA